MAEGKMGFWSLVSMGVGGMVGGGIFAVLGLSVQMSRGGAPVAFLVAGLVALLTARSYARLSAGFPSRGGTVTFVNEAFGDGLFSGSLNILLWISYIVMLALYASAFGSYGASFFDESLRGLMTHLLESGIIVLIALLNFLSAALIGEAEDLIVAVKLVILGIFIGVGVFQVHPAALAPAEWSGPVSLVAGGMIIFLAYEGFELIANAGEDTKNPKKVMPRAYYTSVIFVILLYVAVAAVAVGSLPVSKIVAAKDYALAEAAKPSMGQVGFTLIGVAAMLSTASAINATLYGAARLSYTIARSGELPAVLEKEVWSRPLEGLVLTALLAGLLVNLFDLESISLMGSAGFLLVFAAANAANVRLADRTGGRAWISGVAAAACVGAFGVLVWRTATDRPLNLVVLGVMLILAVGGEALYRRFRDRVSARLEHGRFASGSERS